MINKEDIETQQKIAEITKNSLKLDNSLTTKITTGDVVIKLNDNSKSILEIGNIKIYNIKKFNWFNRLMFKLFFGIKIEKVGSDNNGNDNNK